MSILSRPNRHRLRFKWTSSRRPSSTTDDIPPKIDPISKSLQAHPPLKQHASDPNLQNARLFPLPAPPTPPTVSANADMHSEATITFTQPGVQPPVYVVTSLSTPPWEPLELKPSKEQTSSGDLVFEQGFDNVNEGSYQYKIRIGEGHWVVDESKESATDEHGNRNNVVHAKPASYQAPLDQPTNTKDTLDRKDSTLDTSDMNARPIPFVVVEKVTDRDRPEYGNVQSKSLSVDESKRVADPDPDFEETTTDTPLDTTPLRSPEVPLVMVEKVDDKPAHGDDFGDDATNGQKLAHELRAADAAPDQLIISSQEPDELEPSDARAPLFRHESFQDSEASLPEPGMDKIEEESTQSSTDHTSSGDTINTPSAESQDELQDEYGLGHGSVLSLETSLANLSGELERVPLLSHETRLDAEDHDDDEFDHGPLLSHETGFTPAAEDVDSDYENEYDVAPLLSHETGFSSSEGGHLSKDEYDYDPEQYAPYGGDSDDGGEFGELDHAPTFAHEQDLLTEDYGAPLLSHERDFATESMSGSERSFSMSPTTYESAYPAFGQDTGSVHSNFFRTRTSSSTLPNKLPRSDAEDTNLHDPGLEAFPVGREQILERVATIGNKLPEDETHAAPTSPQPSVLSQACSSVDLAPVKSHISLASVREDSEEEDEEEHADDESLPSPMYMTQQGARFAREKDPLATPHPDDSKQLGFIPEEKTRAPSTRAGGSSEADSVGKNDGTRDNVNRLANLPAIVASKATVMNTLTPPLTPKALEALSDKSESTLRQRRERVKESPDSSAPTPRAEDDKDEDVRTDDAPMITSVAENLNLTKGTEQSWKLASIGILVVVAAVVAYAYLSVKQDD